MWRKVLKCRDIAKDIYKVEAKDGRKTSFWHEAWSSMGCLEDILGEGAHIDMGIPVDANVEASRNHRKRHHLLPILNKVELEMENYKVNY